MTTTDAPFVIEEDPARGLLSVTLRDFWTDEVFDRYRSSVIAALRRMNATRPGQTPASLWVDLRHCPVQSPDMIARLAALEKELRPLVAKMAVLPGTQLKAIQARRVGSGDTYKVSLAEDELLAWLQA